MPEPAEGQTADNLVSDATRDVQPDGQQQVQSEPQPNVSELFGENFKDFGDAAKSYKEIQRKVTQVAEENARLKEQAALVDVLKGLTKAQEPQPEPQKRNDVEAYVTELAEDFQTDPAKASKKLLAAVDAWVTDGQKQSSSYADRKIQEATKELRGQLETLRESVEKSDSAYQENRDMIEALRADGLSLSKAKEWAIKLNEQKPVRNAPPTSLMPSRQIDHAGSNGKRVYLTPEDRAAMKAGGLSDQALDRMEREYWTRFDAEQRRAKK